MTEDGTFPVDYLDFFENILSYSSTDENDDDCLNYEFVNNLYNFTKKNDFIISAKFIDLYNLCGGFDSVFIEVS